MSTWNQTGGLQEQMNNAPGRVEMTLHTAGSQMGRWLHSWRSLAYHRRLRRAIIRSEKRFNTLYPEWQDLLFDRHFLLHGGLPIIERHIEKPAFNDAMDLALAWAEQWPAMSPNGRKAYLQALTLIAAELLRLLDLEPIQPSDQEKEPARLEDARPSHIGIPRAYLQALC